MNDEYKQAVLDLRDLEHGGTSFKCELYRLFEKADDNNKHKLSLGFPVEFKAYENWYYSDDPDKFFEEVLKGEA